MNSIEQAIKQFAAEQVSEYHRTMGEGPYEITYETAQALYDALIALKDHARSLLLLIDALGGRGGLDDAGPDRKLLAEVIGYEEELKEPMTRRIR